MRSSTISAAEQRPAGADVVRDHATNVLHLGTKAPSLRTMEKEMIALENHIEQETAEEKTSTTDMQSRTADDPKGLLPSSEISRKNGSAKVKSAQADMIESVKAHIASKGESRTVQNSDEVSEPQKAAGKAMAKTAGMPENGGVKSPAASSHILRQAPATSDITVPVNKAEPVSSPISTVADAHAVLRKKTSLSDTMAPSPSLESMEREVIELEKQIQRHMAAREQALVKVAAATSKCNPADAACGQAKDQIHWKISQDKYEQAAMKDILKQDRENSTQEGQALFHHYANQAEQLSGIRSLASLNNRTAALVREHIRAEHLSLRALRAAEDRLDRLKMAERRMLDAKQAALDRAAISRAQRHIKRETELMTGPRTPATAPAAPAQPQHHGDNQASAAPTHAPPPCRYNCESAAAAAAQLEPGASLGGAAGPAAVAAAYDVDAAVEGAPPPPPRSQQQQNPYTAQSLSAPFDSDAQASPGGGGSAVPSESAAPVGGIAVAPGAARVSAAAATVGSVGGDLSDEAYRRDFARAQTVEILRRKAFVQMEREQKAKVWRCCGSPSWGIGRREEDGGMRRGVGTAVIA